MIIQVSLSNVKGTGPEGRIVKADIEDYLGMSILLFIWIFLLWDGMFLAAI